MDICGRVFIRLNIWNNIRYFLLNNQNSEC